MSGSFDAEGQRDLHFTKVGRASDVCVIGTAKATLEGFLCTIERGVQHRLIL